ncbi:MAG: hypothetical protein K6U04_03825 [Armatimonadetes bacterium]|nr:hypothetical protein [Armatimonadota bacterium]
MSVPLEKTAKILRLSKEELTEEGLKAYLREKRREIRAEIISIYAKYKVFSLKELDQKISRGELTESDTFEDFTRLDYLESEEDKLKKLMRSLK